MTEQQSPSRGGARVPGEPAATSSAEALGSTAVESPTAAPDEGGGTSLPGIFRDYWQRVRGGEVGALPAILGLVVLVVIFSAASNVFLTRGNLANLPSQAAATALIAMGLIFVLLLGEIDLSAGTASGVCAATMALAVNHDGNLRKFLGSGTFSVIVLLMIGAIAVAVIAKLWPAAVVVVVGLLLLFTTLPSHVLVAIYLAIATGVAIGLLTGFLVARVGIPSFVVTLALFLAWQGVLLQYIGNGNAVPVREFSIINGLANKNLSPVLGWLLLLVLVGGYAAYTLLRSTRRRSEGLSSEPILLVGLRATALAVVGIVIVYFLNQERSPNPATASIRGMPYVVPIILLLMVLFTYVLTKTPFGRYMYAVGGNPEAARRAGIDVARIRVAAFAISSGLAAFGGVVLASKLGGVPSDAGGGNTLLYAVGAAVIGGTSLFGGRGRPRDAVLGAVVISLIPNGLGLLPNLGSSYNFIITGLVLLVAASIDALSRKRSLVAGR